MFDVSSVKFEGKSTRKKTRAFKLILKIQVQKVVKTEAGFVIHTEDEKDHEFDIVILATPLTSDTQTLHLEGTKPINTGGKYHR